MNFDFERDDILDYVQKNPSTVVALTIIVLLLVAYLILIGGTLVPRWQQRTELIAAQATAESAWATRTAQQQAAADQLDRQIETAQAEFNQTVNRFLTETQAAAFLTGLYDSAAETAVAIVELQVLASPQKATVPGEKPVYDTRLFHLEAEGEWAQLNEFVGRIEQPAVSGINLQNLVITRGEAGATDRLTLDLLLFTSPFSTGESVADLPELRATPAPQVSPVPTASPTPDVSALITQLDGPWAAENWPEVIRLIQEIRQQAPNEPGMTEKLYAARVNYGYQLAGLGETAAAADQFEQALAIFPQGPEAEAGLQLLLAPEPTPTPETTIYVVQRGDTLFSIARRFGSTVEAVKAANNLMSNNITPGQQLVIP